MYMCMCAWDYIEIITHISPAKGDSSSVLRYSDDDFDYRLLSCSCCLVACRCVIVATAVYLVSITTTIIPIRLLMAKQSSRHNNSNSVGQPKPQRQRQLNQRDFRAKISRFARRLYNIFNSIGNSGQ